MVRIAASTLLLLSMVFLAADAAAEPGVEPAESVSDARTRAELLRELNRLADAGETKRAADLLGELPGASAGGLVLPEPRRELLGGVDLYRRLREGTVIVGLRYKCKKCSNWHLNAASGFFVTADGVVATNHHVLAVEGADAVAVMDGAGRVHAVTGTVAGDADHDVVLVRVAGSGFTPLPLAQEPTPAGTEVAVMSHPDGRFWMFTTGHVSRVAEWTSGRGGARPGYDVLCITAPFAPGSSGAAVVDRQGNAVGIAVRIMPILKTREGGAGAEGEKDRDHAHGGEYTAMVIPMAIPARWVLELVKPR